MDHDPLAFLIGALLRSTALLGVAFLVIVAVRRLSAEERHLILAAAVAGLLVMPAAALLPKAPVPLDAFGAQLERWAAAAFAAFDRRESVAGDAAGAAAAGETGSSRPAVDAESGAGDPRSSSNGRGSGSAESARGASAAGAGGASAGSDAGAVAALAARAVQLYLAVAALILVYVALAAVRVARRVRSLAPLTDPAAVDLAAEVAREIGLRRRIRLRVSEDDATPWAWGLARPAVVLPRSFRTWPYEDRRNALVHELSHVRRLDMLSMLLGHLCCALYWLQPLAWAAVRRLRREAEHACDDRVLLRGADEPAYAAQLLDIARTLHREGRRRRAATAMAGSSFVSDRIKSILDLRMRRRTVGTYKTACALAATLSLVVPLATVTPQEADPAVAIEEPELRALLYNGPSDALELERIVEALLANDRAAEAARVLADAIAGDYGPAVAECRICVQGLMDEGDRGHPGQSELAASIWNAFDAVEERAQRQADGTPLLRLATIALESRNESAIDIGVLYLVQTELLGIRGESGEQGRLIRMRYLLELGQYDEAEALASSIYEDPASSLYQSTEIEQWLRYIEAERTRMREISAKLASPGEITAIAEGEYLPLHKIAPIYPEEAARQRREGSVIVEYTVTPYGRTADARVVRSTDAIFEETALASVAAYRYLPRFEGGAPTAVPGVRTKITFMLER